GAGAGGGSVEIEEGARVGSVKPRPRRGRAAGSTEESLPRRPTVRSVVYRRTFEIYCQAGLSSPVRSEEEGLFGVPAPLENKGESATRPWWQLRQPHKLQRGKHGRPAIFLWGLRPACVWGLNAFGVHGRETHCYS
ncbi:unnamed protein product, partial [Ectocarpus sp. 8 AP-2014]